MKLSHKLNETKNWDKGNEELLIFLNLTESEINLVEATSMPHKITQAPAYLSVGCRCSRGLLLGCNVVWFYHLIWDDKSNERHRITITGNRETQITLLKKYKLNISLTSFLSFQQKLKKAICIINTTFDHCQHPFTKAFLNSDETRKWQSSQSLPSCSLLSLRRSINSNFTIIADLLPISRWNIDSNLLSPTCSP